MGNGGTPVVQSFPLSLPLLHGTWCGCPLADLSSRSVVKYGTMLAAQLIAHHLYTCQTAAAATASASSSSSTSTTQPSLRSSADTKPTAVPSTADAATGAGTSSSTATPAAVVVPLRDMGVFNILGPLADDVTAAATASTAAGAAPGTGTAMDLPQLLAAVSTSLFTGPDRVLWRENCAHCVWVLPPPPPEPLSSSSSSTAPAVLSGSGLARPTSAFAPAAALSVAAVPATSAGAASGAVERIGSVGTVGCMCSWCEDWASVMVMLGQLVGTALITELKFPLPFVKQVWVQEGRGNGWNACVDRCRCPRTPPRYGCVGLNV